MTVNLRMDSFVWKHLPEDGVLPKKKRLSIDTPNPRILVGTDPEAPLIGLACPDCSARANLQVNHIAGYGSLLLESSVVVELGHHLSPWALCCCLADLSDPLSGYQDPMN